MRRYRPGSRFRVQAYGMTQHADLFTNRQLTALTTFSDLVSEAREQILKDASAAGLIGSKRLFEGGVHAEAYADASLATYLAFLSVSRLAAHRPSQPGPAIPRMQSVVNVFRRQALPMTWDYAEANPFANAGGTLSTLITTIARPLETVPSLGSGRARQLDASARETTPTS